MQKLNQKSNLWRCWWWWLKDWQFLMKTKNPFDKSHKRCSISLIKRLNVYIVANALLIVFIDDLSLSFTFCIKLRLKLWTSFGSCLSFSVYIQKTSKNYFYHFLFLLAIHLIPAIHTFRSLTHTHKYAEQKIFVFFGHKIVLFTSPHRNYQRKLRHISFDVWISSAKLFRFTFSLWMVLYTEPDRHTVRTLRRNWGKLKIRKKRRRWRCAVYDCEKEDGTKACDWIWSRIKYDRVCLLPWPLSAFVCLTLLGHTSQWRLYCSPRDASASASICVWYLVTKTKRNFPHSCLNGSR